MAAGSKHGSGKVSSKASSRPESLIINFIMHKNSKVQKNGRSKQPRRIRAPSQKSKSRGDNEKKTHSRTLKKTLAINRAKDHQVIMVWGSNGFGQLGVGDENVGREFKSVQHIC